MAAKVTAAEKAEWLDDLRATLPPGSTVHTVIRHVSASGMSRAIDAYTLSCDGDRIAKRRLSYRIAAVLGYPFSERYEAVNVGGAGMDMGFHLVYSLSSRLYPDGFDCTGEHCPSNDHTNGNPRSHEYVNPTYVASLAAEFDDTCTVYRCGLPAISHPTRPHHNDGGYALRQEWL